jgi:ribonuclease HI
MNHSFSLWELYIDGAARNNPGPAGAGIYLLKDGCSIVEEGFYLGTKTNNQAEYLALLLGVMYVKRYMQANDMLIIHSDSQLLVRQLMGIYAIKNVHIKLFCSAFKDLTHMLHYKIVHIRREKNVVADRLANNGIDKKSAIPQEFSKIMACL